MPKALLAKEQPPHKAHLHQSRLRAANHMAEWRCIRPCLNLTATQLFVQALVMPRLDYCNALYVGLPQQQLGRLQRIQNAAARFITCTPRHEHISPVLMQLHWLKVPQRITFKILTLTFLAIHGKAPTYYASWSSSTPCDVNYGRRAVQLCWSSHVPEQAAGDRAFVTAVPRLWNCLPADIRCISTISSFKKHQKSYLFSEGCKQLQ